MLRVDRDADAAVEARIRIASNKFQQLVPFLTNINCNTGYRDILKICRYALAHNFDK